VRVKIRYFGRFAMELGKFSEEVEIPDGARVRDLIDFLREKYPSLRNERIEISVNGRYAREDEEIKGEVAVYPPISGG